MKLTCEFLHRGDTSQVSRYFAPYGWDEYLEAHVMDKQAWVANLSQYTEAMDRWEITVHSSSGEVLGGAVLILDPFDVHVGNCLDVVQMYIMPEHRGGGTQRMLMREFLRLARIMGIPHIQYSHRVGVGKFINQYRRVHGKRT